ncbi:hypothetical protein HY991_06185 [Candidatus Micrarchaeota archaeon]|nr:hypothetical protein [Candidatus Micrarchaeota archaeon]
MIEETLSVIAIAVYFLFLAVGSVSFGYMVLRITYPDVRVLPNDKRLGASGILGVVIVSVSFAIDAFISGSFIFGGYFAVIAFFVILFSIAVFWAFFSRNKPAFITVALPTPEPGVLAPKEKALPQFYAKPETKFIEPTEKKEIKKGPEYAEGRAETEAVEPVSATLPTKTEAVKMPSTRGEAGWIAAKSEHGFGKEITGEVAKRAVEAKPAEAGKTVKEDFFTRVKSVFKPVSDLRARKKTVEEQSISLVKAAGLPERIEIPEKAKGIPARERVAERKKEEAKAVAPAKETKPEKAPPVSKLLEIKKEILPEEVLVEVPVAAGEKAKPVPVSEKTVKPKEREMQKELKKAKETEAEVIISDIVKEKKEEATKTLGAGQVHRLYMLKPEERAQLKTVKVIASKEDATKEEFGAIVQDVYMQLKKPAEEKPPAKEEAKPVAEAVAEKPMPQRTLERRGAKPSEETQPALTIEEVIGGAAPKKEPEIAEAPEAKGTPLFAELEKISSSKEEASKGVEKKEAGTVSLKIQAEKGMGCPTCHSSLTRIVFCPYCGAGMCANCSPSVKTEEDHFVYVCPKCGEEVTVRKRMY